MPTKLRYDDSNDAEHAAKNVAQPLQRSSLPLARTSPAGRVIRKNWRALAVATTVVLFVIAYVAGYPADDLRAFRKYAIDRHSQINGPNQMTMMRVKGLTVEQILSRASEAFPESQGWTKIEGLGYPPMGYETYKGAKYINSPRVVITPSPESSIDTFDIIEEVPLTPTQKMIHEWKLKVGLEARKRA